MSFLACLALRKVGIIFSFITDHEELGNIACQRMVHAFLLGNCERTFLGMRSEMTIVKKQLLTGKLLIWTQHNKWEFVFWMPFRDLHSATPILFRWDSIFGARGYLRQLHSEWSRLELWLRDIYHGSALARPDQVCDMLLRLVWFWCSR